MASTQAGGAPPGNVPKGKFRIPGGAQVPKRELGRTGERVSIVGLGGYHLGIPSEEESVRIIRTARKKASALSFVVDVYPRF